MAEPPRLPAILVPWENSIIYFVTICVKDRRKVLATPEVFGAIKTAIPQLRKHLRPQSWEWQRGCFDRLLRSDDSAIAQARWSAIMGMAARMLRIASCAPTTICGANGFM